MQTRRLPRAHLPCHHFPRRRRPSRTMKTTGGALIPIYPSTPTVAIAHCHESRTRLHERQRPAGGVQVFPCGGFPSGPTVSVVLPSGACQWLKLSASHWHVTGESASPSTVASLRTAHRRLNLQGLPRSRGCEREAVAGARFPGAARSPAPSAPHTAEQDRLLLLFFFWGSHCQ